MEPVSDLLGDQGGVAASAVVDNQVHLDLVFYSLVHDLNGILDHLRIQHAGNHFVVVENGGRLYICSLLKKTFVIFDLHAETITN